MNRNVWLVVGAALIMTMALASGCGYLENTGTARDNIKPKVFIANVPLSSVNYADTFWTGGVIDSITYDYDSVVATATYFANPRIHWFGTDEDGRVDAYEYAVIPTDSLNPHPAGVAVVNTASGVNPDRFATNPASTDSLDWIYVEAPTATVGLYADIDTNLAIDQFLFVRAIDNLGLRSDIKFARYSRRNHPPDSYIQLDTIEVIRLRGSPDVVRGRKYYSLPQSTETYPGITIGWSGSDSIDYPEIQPPFEFNWVLYGPFVSKDAATNDSSKMVRTNDNPNTVKLEWTDQDRHTFFNLRSGWYMFEVRSRDDAFVSDPTPARTRFEVVEPSFDKPYMLMDASNYWEGVLVNAGAINFQDRFAKPDILPTLTPDSIHQYYFNLFANQGWEFSSLDVWTREDLKDKNQPQRLMPDRDVLARYKALIVFDFDIHSPLDKDVQGGPQFTPALSEYMNVGGRVVLIGRNLFGFYVTNWSANTPPQEVSFTAADFAFRYFGVTRMYFPGHYWLTSEDPDRDGSKFTDFIGVLPLDPNFPQMQADTSTPYLSWYPPAEGEDPPDTVEVRGRPNLLTPHGLATVGWGLTPDINWIGIDRTRGAEGFYQFSSSRPNTSPSQGRICGARFEYYDRILNRPTYRTAVVTFELWTLEHGDKPRRLAKELLTYILE